ncbi:CRISPR-associated endoribonuclease Cas6 [Candidatus Venteria ishoeyi]|uniref:CRISPR associated protein Cas6 n=1 Tax=Candidatus Venteria ishoeyi TaxID=1899563 RepID=A0A1H6FDC8_9GAMM|nr:CRISPR-associated endoribonuclease Cas6 [Candidatus Venteria ishoeyi]SEH07166.1 CRISPR associated protein Cas6 [Candidatus Venteria ishoeyi]
MLRIRITLPKNLPEDKRINYRYQDILHDALVNAWLQAKADKSNILDRDALAWNFAALGWHRKDGNQAHSLVVSTAAPLLAETLVKLNCADIRYTRAHTLESVDFSPAEIHIEPDPIVPGQTALGVVMLSPLAIRDYHNGKRWHTDLSQVDLSTAINTRLSRLAGREVKLKIQADSLYLRCNPKHSTLVPLKQMKNGKTAFVIGMDAPLVLQGSEGDLRLAWYAGIGEKTRNGFGCIGLAEQGIGR